MTMEEFQRAFLVPAIIVYEVGKGLSARRTTLGRSSRWFSPTPFLTLTETKSHETSAAIATTVAQRAAGRPINPELEAALASQ